MTIEAFWVPGCTSCLRMKEFLERHGCEYESVNLAEEPDRGERLKPFGLLAPAVVVGDRGIPGLDLQAIAELIGVVYDRPALLPPDELQARYRIISATVCRLVAQVSPEQIVQALPGRNRTTAALAAHAGNIMRAFLYAYDHDVCPRDLEGQAPEGVTTPEAIVAWTADTESMFDRWWQEAGFDDPLDRVVETQWGHRTLHEVLERAVWHVAQHTRQLASFLEQLAIEPDRPLRPEDLAGLPLPERVYA